MIYGIIKKGDKHPTQVNDQHQCEHIHMLVLKDKVGDEFNSNIDGTIKRYKLTAKSNSKIIIKEI